jgi:hypothetical protein
MMYYLQRDLFDWTSRESLPNESFIRPILTVSSFMSCWIMLRMNAVSASALCMAVVVLTSILQNTVATSGEADVVNGTRTGVGVIGAGP